MVSFNRIFQIIWEVYANIGVADVFTHFGCPHFTVPVVAVVLIICVEQVEDVEKAAADATGDGEEQHDLVSCLLEDQLDWASGDEVEQAKDSPKGSHGCFGKKKRPL